MKDLAEFIMDAVDDREVRMRQGKVLGVNPGPPVSLTVDISGVSYSGIRVMDHVLPVVGEGVWMLDMGIGRWMVVGTTAQIPGSFLSSYGVNLLDNASGAIAQRGAIVSGIVGTAYALDRWQLEVSNLGNWKVEQVVDGPPGLGIRTSMKISVNTADASPAAADYAVYTQRIEGYYLQGMQKGTASAKNCAVSVYAYTNLSGTYVVNLYDVVSSRWVSGQIVATAGGWQKHFVNFIGDTSGVIAPSAVYGLRFGIWLAAGTNYTGGAAGSMSAWNTTQNLQCPGQVNLAATAGNYIILSGIKFEVGDYATPFDVKPFDEELIKCMRYLEKSYKYADAPGSATVGYTYESCKASSATNIDPGPSIEFKVLKRVLPGTVSFWRPDGSVGTWLWNAGSGTPILYIPTERGFKTYTTTAAGLTAGQMYTVNGHWLASSEA